MCENCETYSMKKLKIMIVEKKTTKYEIDINFQQKKTRKNYLIKIQRS